MTVGKINTWEFLETETNRTINMRKLFNQDLGGSEIP
jgi:hypothetical protein